MKQPHLIAKLTFPTIDNDMRIEVTMDQSLIHPFVVRAQVDGPDNDDMITFGCYSNLADAMNRLAQMVVENAGNGTYDELQEVVEGTVA